MPIFIKGLVLCERFFEDIVKPILDERFPRLAYSAGLVGYGSDVLGFDDEVSTDHMWGPRLYLFLHAEDIGLKDKILSTFSMDLPYEFSGYSVNFSQPDPNGNSVRVPEPISSGPISPLIFIHTFEEYLRDYLGVDDPTNLSALDWLSFSEHRLLSLTSGKWFKDDLGLKESLSGLGLYPEEVRIYLIASNWSLIGEEQAFVRRCSDVGDEVGSILACARITERLMHLAFLYCRRYAPYSKWFGTAFGMLPIEENIRTAIRTAVMSATIDEREDNLVLAQKLLADLHDSFRITEPIELKTETTTAGRSRSSMLNGSALRRRKE